MRDLFHHIDSVPSLAPAARTGDTDGDGVDLANRDGAVIEITAGARTDGTHTFVIEESDDDVTYTEVAAGHLQGEVPVIDATGGANAVHRLGYLGRSRYIRVGVTVTGATTGAVYGANVIRGYPRKIT